MRLGCLSHPLKPTLKIVGGTHHPDLGHRGWARSLDLNITNLRSERSKIFTCSLDNLYEKITKIGGNSLKIKTITICHGTFRQFRFYFSKRFYIGDFINFSHHLQSTTLDHKIHDILLFSVHHYSENGCWGEILPNQTA